MEEIYSKARAFHLINAFEQDLRYFIDLYLLDHLSEIDVFGKLWASLTARQESDDSAGSELSISNYLHLREAYDCLLTHDSLLPRDLGDELRRNVAGLGPIVGVRNRVMHSRPLMVDDLDVTDSFIGRFVTRYFTITRDVLAHLRSDKYWEPSYESTPTFNDRVLHNLPAADYDETGLVGRTKDLKAVTDLLLRGRDRMITITGEGGIGKTALALQVAYQQVDSVDPIFDAVLWVSLKSEVLTAVGVRSISNALRDIAGATDVLGQLLDPSFSGSVAELAEYLSGLRTLVVIDNLESAQGTEVVDLYDHLPESVTFLFTSRVGIGQIERRVVLSELSDTESELLFRKFASRRRQNELAGLDKAVVNNTTTALRNSPLAIRWFIQCVESGRTPNEILRNQIELLKFCVDNVYEALASETRLILAILRSLDRSISFDELAVVSEIAVDQLRRSVQELSQGSLLVRTPAKTVSDTDRLELTSTARAYLPRSDQSSAVMERLLGREAAYVRDREEHRLAEAQREMDANVIRVRGPEDEPTAYLLRLALRLASSDRINDAHEYIERARSLNPDFFEVDRVEAFLASIRGDLTLASAKYRAALETAVTDSQKAIVLHFYAGHAARVGHDVVTAIEMETIAHEVLNNVDTALALGNFHIWNRDFAIGQEFLDQAMVTPSSKFLRIVTTALVESWRRWGEAELENHAPASAVEKGLAGLYCGRGLIESGNQDIRLADAILRAVIIAMQGHTRDRHAFELAVPTRVVEALKFVNEHYGMFRATRSWDRLRIALQPFESLREAKDLLGRIGPVVSVPNDGRTGGIEVVRRGTIVNLRDTYGFIGHPDYATNLFFHFGSLGATTLKTEVTVGSEVEFTVYEDESGRVRARNVSQLIR